MANHKSSVKRTRQTIKRNARASRTKKTIRTLEKNLRTAITDKKKDEASKLLISFSSKSDKAAQKGYLHKNTSSRKISRLSSQVAAL